MMNPIRSSQQHVKATASVSKTTAHTRACQFKLDLLRGFFFFFLYILQDQQNT